VRDELLEYYERELGFIRQMGVEFANKYPKVAGRLLLEPDRCEDPHVERLMEAFAFLAARLHLKIDDEFPEITESLIEILYPHFLRPLPSMSVVELRADPEQGKLSTGVTVPRGTLLYSRAVDGVSCKFRTSYDATVWPLRIDSAEWRSPAQLQVPLKAPDAFAACSIRLSCAGDTQFPGLKVSSLAFYLNGESSLTHTLYELLLNNCLRILVRNPKAENQRPIVLPATSLRPVGFVEQEAILPYPRRSFTGYRLIQEYFAFPEKFLFLEMKGLDVLTRSEFGDSVELVFLISPFERNDRQQMLELSVSDKTFRLGCTPIVNMFPQTAEPILLEQTRFEYPVVPDFRRPHALEVFSVEEVLTSSPDRQEIIYYEPFYSTHHGRGERMSNTFWHAHRRPSLRQHDLGTEVYLSLVDSSGELTRRASDTLTVRCMCTNRDLPSRLPFGNEAGDFEVEGASTVKRVVSLRKPTAPIRPPVRKGLQWRLLSHLSLNYLSLVEDGRGALQEILRLYNFSDSTYCEQQIAGITGLKSARHFARVVSENGISFARGLRIELEMDEDLYVGAGAFLFSSVLERFFALYTSLNSFSQLVVRTKQRKEAMREWKPRAGNRILL
jgi:type VI secretion system protein ImpG